MWFKMDDILCMQNIINITGMIKGIGMGVFLQVDTKDDWFIDILQSSVGKKVYKSNDCKIARQAIKKQASNTRENK